MKYSLLVQAGRKLLMRQAADWRVMMDEFVLTCLHAFSFPGYESAPISGELMRESLLDLNFGMDERSSSPSRSSAAVDRQWRLRAWMQRELSTRNSDRII